MIEYTDDKIGKVKVVSVTEARANFATVLRDESSHYVITKNNKAVRVIIGYQEYERLRRGIQAKGLALEESGLAEARIIEKRAAKQPHAVKTKKSSKNRVPGMLRESMSLSKTKERPAASAPPMPTAGESQELLPPQPQEPQEKIAKNHRAEVQSLLTDREGLDYFSSSDGEAEDEVLPVPEAPEVAPREPIPKTAAAAAAPEPVEKAPQEDTGLTREEEEYFKKYRKLYEPLPPLESQSESAGVDDITSQLSAKFESEGSDESKEVPVANSLSEETSEEAPPKAGPSSAEAAEKKAGEEELPSLKELLKDLEEEMVLSEEESGGELDDKEIDELIQRITQD